MGPNCLLDGVSMDGEQFCWMSIVFFSHSPAATAVLTPNQDNQTDSHVCPSDMKRPIGLRSIDTFYTMTVVNVIPAVEACMLAHHSRIKLLKESHLIMGVWKR